jgi:hypothetical protein
MRSKRRYTSLFALAFAAIMFASCADDFGPPTAPAEPVAIAPNPLLGGVIGTVTGVVGDLLDLGFSDCPADRTQSGSAWIGPSGGTVRVGPHRLKVPRGALKEGVQISGVAPEGAYAQIKFEPEGLNFKRPATLVMSYEGCRIADTEDDDDSNEGVVPRFQIVYVSEGLEILKVLPTTTNADNETATTSLNHFSRYMLAD